MARFRVCGSNYDLLCSYDTATATEEAAVEAFKAKVNRIYWDEKFIYVINFDVPATKAYDREYRENVPWEEGRKYQA